MIPGFETKETVLPHYIALTYTLRKRKPPDESVDAGLFEIAVGLNGRAPAGFQTIYLFGGEWRRWNNLWLERDRFGLDLCAHMLFAHRLRHTIANKNGWLSLRCACAFVHFDDLRFRERTLTIGIHCICAVRCKHRMMHHVQCVLLTIF